MPNYRRLRVAGGWYFFTVVTAERQPILTTSLARRCLREALSACRRELPFEVAAHVLLPDHIHTIWILPSHDDRFSLRSARVKGLFTRAWLAAGGSEAAVSESQQGDHRRGVWQRRFWEHALRDERDFEQHLDYIHYNPVKHGYVATPLEWRWSSFQRWAERGRYELDWCPPPPEDQTIERP